MKLKCFFGTLFLCYMCSVDSGQVDAHHDMLPSLSRRSADHGVQEVLAFSITSPDYDENDEDHRCVSAVVCPVVVGTAMAVLT